MDALTVQRGWLSIYYLPVYLHIYRASERRSRLARRRRRRRRGSRGRRLRRRLNYPHSSLPPSHFLLPSFVLHAYNHRCREERAGRRRRRDAAACSRGFSRLLNFSPLLDLDGPLAGKFGGGCVISPEHYTKPSRVDLSSARM